MIHIDRPRHLISLASTLFCTPRGEDMAMEREKSMNEIFLPY